MPVWDKAAFDRFYKNYPERWGRPNNRPPIVLGYHWLPILQWQRRDYSLRLYNTLGLQPGQDVILVGCGFNATAAGLMDLGVRAIGVDTSAYIDSEKANTEEAEIREAIIAAGLDPDVDKIVGPNGLKELDPLEYMLEGGRNNPQPRGKGQILAEDLRLRGSRNSVINAFESQFPGASIRYIITEEVLNSITDNEAGLVCSYVGSAAQEWGATVVHMLSCNPMDGVIQDPELNWKTYGEWRTWLNSNGFNSQFILPTIDGLLQGITLTSRGIDGYVDMYGGLI